MVGADGHTAAVRNFGMVVGTDAVTEIKVFEFAIYPVQPVRVCIDRKRTVDLVFVQDVAQEIESRFSQ
jgi:hypothetical protein